MSDKLSILKWLPDLIYTLGKFLATKGAFVVSWASGYSYMLNVFISNFL